MKFTSPLGPDALLIESLEGSEGISRLFDFEAELLATTGSDIDPADIIGQKVTIETSLVDADDSRYVNGMVIGFAQAAGDTEYDVYRAQIVPSLWQLTLSSNCRVFQNQTAMDIIKAVISPYGLSVSDKTEGALQALDYCTQYSETDFNFISRLAEQHGIFYWFEHSDSDNMVVFSNARSAYGDCPIVNSITYSPNANDGEHRYVSSIEEIRSTATMVTGQHSTQDYDFRSYAIHKANPASTASPFANNTYESYRYPGGEEGYVKNTAKALSTPDHASGFTTARGGASDLGAEVLHGTSNARTFVSGFTFTMTDHPRDAWNRKYLLTEVVHHADQVPSYRSNNASDGTYTNRFTAVSSDLVFRPPVVTPKPTIPGPQTALVVTASGEDFAIDTMGRVCVQFFWDRLRPANTVDNTWVRVAQHWAGSGWGTYFWPRVNDEVIVQFLNGDPDNPIVVGSVYNGVNVPKYPTPDMQTRSGILTRSSKGGGAANANELRFEDKMGAEQIFVNAEKDLDFRVENDSRTYVMAQNSHIVDKDHLEKFNGDHHYQLSGARKDTIGGTLDRSVTGAAAEKFTANYGLTVGGDSAQQVSGKLGQKVDGAVAFKYGDSLSLNVSQNIGEKAGMNYAVDAGMEAYIKGGMNVIIEAGMELTLKGAGGFITIGPSGIAISGTMVLINSGGAAGSGTAPTITDPDAPAAPQAPKDPDKADDGTKGTKM